MDISDDKHDDEHIYYEEIYLAHSGRPCDKIK